METETGLNNGDRCHGCQKKFPFQLQNGCRSCEKSLCVDCTCQDCYGEQSTSLPHRSNFKREIERHRQTILKFQEQYKCIENPSKELIDAFNFFEDQKLEIIKFVVIEPKEVEEICYLTFVGISFVVWMYEIKKIVAVSELWMLYAGIIRKTKSKGDYGFMSYSWKGKGKIKNPYFGTDRILNVAKTAFKLNLKGIWIDAMCIPQESRPDFNGITGGEKIHDEMVMGRLPLRAHLSKIGNVIENSSKVIIGDTDAIEPLNKIFKEFEQGLNRHFECEIGKVPTILQSIKVFTTNMINMLAKVVKHRIGCGIEYVSRMWCVAEVLCARACRTEIYGENILEQLTATASAIVLFLNEIEIEFKGREVNLTETQQTCGEFYFKFRDQLKIALFPFEKFVTINNTMAKRLFLLMTNPDFDLLEQGGGEVNPELKKNALQSSYALLGFGAQVSIRNATDFVFALNTSLYGYCKAENKFITLEGQDKTPTPPTQWARHVIAIAASLACTGDNPQKLSICSSDVAEQLNLSNSPPKVPHHRPIFSTQVALHDPIIKKKIRVDRETILLQYEKGGKKLCFELDMSPDKVLLYLENQQEAIKEKVFNAPGHDYPVIYFHGNVLVGDSSSVITLSNQNSNDVKVSNEVIKWFSQIKGSTPQPLLRLVITPHYSDDA